MSIEGQRRRLITAGLLLFLLALLFGMSMVLPWLANQRMGLTAHLVGLLGGLFLLALASIWREHRLSPRLSTAAFWLVLYATYANFFAALLGAVFGTSTRLLTPLAGSGHPAAFWKESVVTFGLVSEAGAIVAGCVLVLWGMRGGGHRSPP